MARIDEYEAALEQPRTTFAGAPAVRTLLDPQTDAVVLEAFLVYYSALGVGMTEPVEGWIRRAGERCVEVGIGELGTALQGHADSEADHHLMMIEDVQRLCRRWNGAREPRLDADELLALPMRDSTRGYRQLHEDVIAGAAPYAQIAIENEIEMLSINWGRPLLDNCVRVLGQEITDDLSFLPEHVEIDVGHTKFNRRQLADFLDERPDALEPLVRAGSEALRSYLAFVTDCVELGEELARTARAPIG